MLGRSRPPRPSEYPVHRLLSHAAVVIAVVPVTLLSPAHAQEACIYEVALREIAIAVARPTPPSGYSYLQQPAGAGSEPGTARALLGTIEGQGEDCRQADVPVALQARQAGSTDFTRVRSTATNGRGEFAFNPRPTRTASVRAAASTPEGQTVTSSVLALPVRAAVSATYTRAPGCVLIATGSTYPSKPGHHVSLQLAEDIDPSGQTAEEVQAFGMTDAQGHYRLRWNAPCGRHDLVVNVTRSASNTAGRTLYVREDVLATREG